MIKIEHLNKYYSKGSKNELHVIDDISLELPSTGLVVILGKSGSGKTTLLNCIGGLDKASGKIDYDDKEFSHYKMGIIDSFRSENVGYVFQNYLLLPDETVWRNIDIALSVYGIADKEERNKRIDASLSSVGMGRYRRKSAGALSGGQKQRVAIARALAKLPSIIIADEPTGNLDSENSLEVMDILRDVASDRLVLLVTHSDELAEAYSDRNIHYADGKIISDEPNKPSPRNEKKAPASVKKDRGILLSSFKKSEKSIGNVSLTSYQDDKTAAPINITLIQKDGQSYLYIDSSAVRINDNSLKITSDETPKEKKEQLSSFDHSSFVSTERKGISFLSMLKRSFVSFFSGKKKFKTRFFRTVCLLIGILTSAVSITAYYSFYTSSYTNISNAVDTANTVLVAVEEDDYGNITKKFSYSEYVKAQEDPSSALTGVVASIKVSSDSFSYSSVSSSDVDLSANVGCYPLNNLTPHVVLGKAPDDPYSCVVSKSLLDSLYPNDKLDYSTFIGRKMVNTSQAFYTGVSSVYCLGKDVSPIVSGISDDAKPFVYLSKEGGIQLLDSSVHNIYTGYSPFASFIDNMSFLLRSEADPGTIYAEYENAGSLSDSEINVYMSKEALALYSLYYGNSNKTQFHIVGTVSGSEAFAVFNADGDYELFKTWFTEMACSMMPMAYLNLDKLNVISGRLPAAVNEIILPYSENTEYPPSSYSENGKSTKYEIVGSYLPDKGQGCYVYTLPTTWLRNIFSSADLFQYSFISSSLAYTINSDYSNAFYSSSPGTTISYFNKLGYRAYNTMEAIEKANSEYNNTNGATSIAISLIVFAIILLLSNALSARSNMIRHIYSISVYRSIGASRLFIYKLFLSDSLINSAFTMELGALAFFICYWIVVAANALTVVPFWIPLAIFVALAFFSLLGSVIPLFFLLRKTPHEIAVKYDI